jgi:MYXO-CTERM domain-containing protein
MRGWTVRWARGNALVRVGWLAPVLVGLVAACASDAQVRLPGDRELELGELTVRYPGLAALTGDLVGAPERFEGGWRLVAQAPRRARPALQPGQGRWRLSERAVTVDLPDGGRGGMQVSVAGAPATIGVHRLGSTDGATPYRAGDALVIEDASRGVDAVLFRRRAAVEELLVVRGPSAPLGYQLQLPEGHTLEKAAKGRVQVRSGGRPVLRVRMESAWDATGAPVDIGVTVEGHQIRLDLEGAPAYPVLVDPAWESTASPATPRERHTATLLPDGRVLVAGGFAAFEPLDSTEIFDPRTGTFDELPLGTMTQPRSAHSATLLPSGRVLVVGGQDPSSTQATVELFDPSTGTWSGQEDPGGGRAGHTATLLPGTRQVLIAGGCVPMSIAKTPEEACESPQTSAEIYTDGAAQPFHEVTPELQPGRAQHRAVLRTPQADVPEVVLFGGDSSAPMADTTSSIQVFDGNAFQTPRWPQMFAQHNSHSATLLPDGRGVLIVGNWLIDGAPDAAEIYDPEFDPAFSSIGATIASRSWHTATLLPDGSVLLAGGLREEEMDAYRAHADVERWVPDPAPSSPSPFVPEPDMLEGRAFHTATLLADGRVLVVGGRAASGSALTSAELYERDPVDPFAPAQTVWNASAGMAAVRLLSGEVLITGGEFVAPRADAFLMDADGAEVSSLPAMHVPRVGHTLTLLPTGDVLVAGGAGDGSAEIFDVDSGEFVLIRSAMVEARAHHSATLLPDGHVLLAGGTSGATPIETFDPSDRTFHAGPIIARRARHTATLLANGAVLLAGGADAQDVATNTALMVTVSGRDPASATIEDKKMSLPRVNHTATILSGGEVLIAGGPETAGDQAEVFLPQTAEFEYVEPLMANKRARHTATLLPSGRVLLAGGEQLTGGLDGEGPAATTAEVFVPLAGGKGHFEAVAGSMQPRTGHIAALLESGHVLLAGGVYNAASHELWRDDVWMNDAFRPAIHTAPAQATAGDDVAIEGAGLVGLSEGSNGATNASATNFPVFVWLPWEGLPSYGGARDWTRDASSWRVPATHYPGPGLLFAYVNGLRSRAVAITVQPQVDGRPCEVGAQCASGHCADGVCCDSPCQERCEACAHAAKGPAAEASRDGKCDPIEMGQPTRHGKSCPEDEPGEVSLACSAGDLCDGDRHCLGRADNPSCEESGVCDGLRCITSCNDGGDCPQGFICTADGKCGAPFGPEDQARGCSCRTAASSHGGHGALALGLALALLRKRRRGSSRSVARGRASPGR